MVKGFQLRGFCAGSLGCRIGVVVLLSFTSLGSEAFVNFETAPIHPVALSPDGSTLAVCNLPDMRVEVFDVSSTVPHRFYRVKVADWPY
jgi:hypothetical protein